jgi:hypothetical protein
VEHQSFEWDTALPWADAYHLRNRFVRRAIENAVYSNSRTFTTEMLIVALEFIPQSLHHRWFNRCGITAPPYFLCEADIDRLPTTKVTGRDNLVNLIGTLCATDRRRNVVVPDEDADVTEAPSGDNGTATALGRGPREK